MYLLIKGVHGHCEMVSEFRASQHASRKDHLQTPENTPCRDREQSVSCLPDHSLILCGPYLIVTVKETVRYNLVSLSSKQDNEPMTN